MSCMACANYVKEVAHISVGASYKAGEVSEKVLSDVETTNRLFRLFYPIMIELNACMEKNALFLSIRSIYVYLNEP
jgi:hypothetical protein